MTRLHHTALPGPDDITRIELDNGITLLTRPNFNSPSVTLSGYFYAGGLNDPDEKLGLADFVAAAVMRGTQSRDFQQTYTALESVGASFGFNSATHTTGFGGRSLVEDLPLLLNLLSDSLRQPVFPEQQVQRLRAQLLTGLTLRSQDTSDMAALSFEQIVYRHHPYQRPEDGYPETIQAISRQDLVDFHTRYYGPRGMVIAIVGAVSPKDAHKLVEHAVGNWVNPNQPDQPSLPQVQPLEKLTRTSIEIPGKTQSDIVLGAAGPKRKSPAFIASSLGNNILGQFGMMGRIGTAVRERAGLAYYAFSRISGGVGPGPWSVVAGVNPKNVEQAIDLIRQEIGRFVTEPVTPEELSDSQANFIGRLPLALESNNGVSSALLSMERHQLGLNYFQRYADLINAITPEDVLLAANGYLHPDKLAIAVAGTSS